MVARIDYGSESSFSCATKTDKKSQHQPLRMFTLCWFSMLFQRDSTGKTHIYRLMRNHLAISDEKNVNSKMYYSEMHVIFLQSCCLFLIFIYSPLMFEVKRKRTSFGDMSKQTEK